MYSCQLSTCNLIFAKWFSETSLNEVVNCNTVVFCKALIYTILDQSSLCSRYQTVTWWITHIHKFLVPHQQKITRYLSFEIKKTSYIYENINKPCSMNSYRYSCLLQVHPEVHHTVQDPRELQGGLSTTLRSTFLSAGPLTRSERGWCVSGLDA